MVSFHERVGCLSGTPWRESARNVPQSKSGGLIGFPLADRDGCQCGGDDVVRGERVSAHYMDGDQLRPLLVALDAGFTGVACGGDFGRVRFEVVSADTGATPDQC